MYLFLFTEVYKTRSGIPKYNQNFINAFSDMYKGKILIISLNDSKKNEEIPNNKNIDFIGCAGIFKDFRFLDKLKFTLLTVYYSLILKPKFIVCGHINIIPLAYILKRVLGIDYISITYGIETWNITDSIKQKGLTLSKLIICISNYTKLKIQNQIPLEESKFFILPCAVDEKSFYINSKPKYLTDRYNVEDCKVVLTICRLDEREKYKGYDKIIKILSRVMAEVPKIKYVIGGTGNDIYRIKKLVNKLGLQDKVIITGFIPEKELVDYYNLCDVFAMPSKGEGFGIVFLEALACGKPVIAGNKDGSVEAVLNGEIGILVNPDDNDAIVNAIIKILKGNIPKKLFDSNYLRGMMLKKYGMGSFKNRVGELMEELQ